MDISVFIDLGKKVFAAIKGGSAGASEFGPNDYVIEQKRFMQTSHSTLCLLFLDGVFECFILEDKKNDSKVYGETRISAGVYPIKLRTENSTLNTKYAKEYPAMHKGMLEITDIPGFSNVYYHKGLTDKDTLGCPLTGAAVDSIKGEIIRGSSSPAYEAMYQKVVAAMDAGKNVYVKITDEEAI